MKTATTVLFSSAGLKIEEKKMKKERVNRPTKKGVWGIWFSALEQFPKDGTMTQFSF